MNKIFLGKPIHWLMIIIATAIIFACGFNKMHVSNFNLFISIISGQIIILNFCSQNPPNININKNLKIDMLLNKIPWKNPKTI